MSDTPGTYARNDAPLAGHTLLELARNKASATRHVRVAGHWLYRGLVELTVYNSRGGVHSALAMTPEEALLVAAALTKAAVGG